MKTDKRREGKDQNRYLMVLTTHPAISMPSILVLCSAGFQLLLRGPPGLVLPLGSGVATSFLRDIGVARPPALRVLVGIPVAVVPHEKHLAARAGFPFPAEWWPLVSLLVEEARSKQKVCKAESSRFQHFSPSLLPCRVGIPSA